MPSRGGGFTGAEDVHASTTLTMSVRDRCSGKSPAPPILAKRLVALAIGDERRPRSSSEPMNSAKRDPTEYFEAGLNTILDGTPGQPPQGRRRRATRDDSPT